MNITYITDIFKLFIITSFAFSYLVFLIYIITQTKIDYGEMDKLNENLKMHTFTIDNSIPSKPVYVQNSSYLIPINDNILMPNTLYGGITFFLLCGTVILSSFAYNNFKEFYKKPNKMENKINETSFLKSIQENYNKFTKSNK